MTTEEIIKKAKPVIRSPNDCVHERVIVFIPDSNYSQDSQKHLEVKSVCLVEFIKEFTQDIAEWKLNNIYFQ